mmetsp:Transcript_86971/g.251215  ORF Transcript_86971/g.251215 Transcript_86971/m.251215 type:complete len:277 (+) Transcript_86971:452-1282(+)
MPLHLPRPGVEHGRWKDGQHDGRVAEDAVLDDGMVLVHPRLQRHVVVLRPAAERGQPEHRLLEAFGLQLLRRVLHQQRVAVVHRVPQLEDEDRVRTELSEFAMQLRGRQAVLVHAIVVLDLPEHLDLAANEPVPGLVDHLDVRVLAVGDPEGPPGALLLDVLKHLRLRQRGHDAPIRCRQGDLVGPLDIGFLLLAARLDDGYGHRDKLAVNDEVLVVQALQELLLGHEAIQWGGPTLREDVHPLVLLLGERQFLELRGGFEQRLPLRGRREQIEGR